MEDTLESLERNARFRSAAVQPMIVELKEINRQMAEHNEAMIEQQEFIITLLTQIRDRL